MPASSASLRVDPLAEQQQLVRLLARNVAVDQRHDHEREHADVDLGRAEGRALLRDDRSHASAMPNAPASTWPPAAQIDGLPSSPSSRKMWRSARIRSACARAARRRRSRPGSRPRTRPSRARRSSTTQRTPSSSRALTKRVDQLPEQLGRQRVAGVRLVERDRRDAAVRDVVEDRLVGQELSRWKWEVLLLTVTDRRWRRQPVSPGPYICPVQRRKGPCDACASTSW